MERKRFAGFDILRILAATAVVFSHSFLIAQGVEDAEPFQKYTGEIIGVYGVMVFFILSGFLVTDSGLRSKSLAAYCAKRARRILPGFIFCVFTTVVILAPLYATPGGFAFLALSQTWSQMLSVLGLYDSSLVLDTVQFYTPSSPQSAYLPSIVNGVLWTIRLEIFCYAVIAVFLFFRILTVNVALLTCAVAAICAFYYSIQINEFLGGVAFLFPSFAAGMLLRMLAYDHHADARIAALCIVILIAFAVMQPTWQKFQAVLFPLLFTYPLLWIGQRDNWVFTKIRSVGDPSYGMYLWGWPIQQVLRSWLGAEWSGYGFFFLCLPLVLLAGYLSWFVVERRFLTKARTTSPSNGSS